MKQILLMLDEEYHFVIESLDDEHLFVDTALLSTISQRVQDILEV